MSVLPAVVVLVVEMFVVVLPGILCWLSCVSVVLMFKFWLFVIAPTVVSLFAAVRIDSVVCYGVMLDSALDAVGVSCILLRRAGLVLSSLPAVLALLRVRGSPGSRTCVYGVSV